VHIHVPEGADPKKMGQVRELLCYLSGVCCLPQKSQKSLAMTGEIYLTRQSAASGRYKGIWLQAARIKEIILL